MFGCLAPALLLNACFETWQRTVAKWKASAHPCNLQGAFNHSAIHDAAKPELKPHALHHMIMHDHACMTHTCLMQEAPDTNARTHSHTHTHTHTRTYYHAQPTETTANKQPSQRMQLKKFPITKPSRILVPPCNLYKPALERYTAQGRCCKQNKQLGLNKQTNCQRTQKITNSKTNTRVNRQPSQRLHLKT